MWPFIEIRIGEFGANGGGLKLFGFKSGCESCYATIPLIDYADNLTDNTLDIQYCKA